MTTQAHVTSVRSEIVVDAPIERAFAVFTEQFDRIKPGEHNMLGVAIAETVLEPRVGGSIARRGVDGTECRWARVLAYDPPERMVFSWDIGPTWQIETDPSRSTRRRHEAPARACACAAPEGGRIEINNFRHRSSTPSLAAAGIKHRRIYDLRHTYATWSLAAGVDIFTLARRMGTSVKMIDRTYGHLGRRRRRVRARATGSPPR
jgi:uncharacterized protein YndB with AHSA1/START domain